jgi:DNA-binding FadR family transcriptional regulator
MASPYKTQDADDDIRVQKLSHAVAQRLRSQIVAGDRKPGDKLPPETELLEQFKVSRPTVREALRILEVESLITMGRGARSGATVLAPSPERASAYAAMVLASNGTTLGELHEARTFMEPTLAMQLAKKRDAKLLEALQQELDHAAVQLAARDYKAAMRAFGQFHGTMILAAENRALSLVLSILRDLSTQSSIEYYAQSSSLLAEDAPRDQSLKVQLQKTLKAYQELVELIRLGKPQEAQGHWHKYMLQAMGFLEKAGLAGRQVRHDS